MRSLSPVNLLQIVTTLSIEIAAFIDGYNIYEHPYISLTKKKQIPNAVPLIAGSVADEGTIFIYPHNPNPLNPAQYASYVNQVFLAFTPYLMEHYPCTGPQDCRVPLSELFGDFSLTCPTFLFTQASSALNQPTYAYLWAHEPIWMAKTSPYYGAYHSSEVAFVFSTFQNIYPFTADEVRLSTIRRFPLT